MEKAKGDNRRCDAIHRVGFWFFSENVAGTSGGGNGWMRWFQLAGIQNADYLHRAESSFSAPIAPQKTNRRGIDAFFKFLEPPDECIPDGVVRSSPWLCQWVGAIADRVQIARSAIRSNLMLETPRHKRSGYGSKPNSWRAKSGRRSCGSRQQNTEALRGSHLRHDRCPLFPTPPSP